MQISILPLLTRKWCQSLDQTPQSSKGLDEIPGISPLFPEEGWDVHAPVQDPGGRKDRQSCTFTPPRHKSMKACCITAPLLTFTRVALAKS